MSRQRGYTGKVRTQQIKKGSIGKRTIGLKAVPLQQQKALAGGVGFHLRDQARFANARFPAEQGNLPPAAFRLLNEQVEGGELGCAPDQDRANDGYIEQITLRREIRQGSPQDSPPTKLLVRAWLQAS